MKFVSLTINGFDVKVAFDENSVHIYNAYPIKDDLKRRGYRWNSDEKTWYNDKNSVEDELSILKNNLRPEDAEQGHDVISTPVGLDKQENPGIPTSSTVSELRNRIERVILESVGGNIWVRGVVASEIKNYKWASYFDFRDEDELKDVFFSAEIKSNYLSSINYKLNKSGVSDSLNKDLPVLLLVNVSLSYKKNVNIRLAVIDIIPEFTREKIKNQREITIDRLKSEGVLENQKKLALPLLTRQIGLISSEQGTSIQDILAGMGSYKNKYDVCFIDARMEGDNAVSSIIKGINYFEKSQNPVDVIVIARGGGSEQSLSIFNDYRICRKVCDSKMTIITAIGHEKDLSAIELCSYLTPSPSTPSGIGKFFFDKYMKTEKDLLNLFSNISNLSYNFFKEHLFVVQNKINSIAIINKRLILDNFFKISDRIKYVFLRVNSKTQLESQKITLMSNKIKPERIYSTLLEKKSTIITRLNYVFDSGNRIINSTDNDLKHTNNIINASDPKNVLKRGFALTMNKNGEIITSKKKFTDKKAVLRFYDGDVKINKIEDENGKQEK